MIYNFSIELFNWLLENEKASTTTKIEKVRSVLGKGNTFSLLGRRLDDGYEGVELHIGIDDYEDENNRENIYFNVEVKTHYEETFSSLKDAISYFEERVSEVCNTSIKEAVDIVFEKESSLKECKHWFENIRVDTYSDRFELLFFCKRCLETQIKIVNK